METLLFICCFLFIIYLSVKFSGVCLTTVCMEVFTSTTVTVMERSCFLQGDRELILPSYGWQKNCVCVFLWKFISKGR